MRTTTLPSKRRHFYLRSVAKFLAALCALLICQGHGRAENPWNSSMGGWSSWDATGGGMFGTLPWESHSSPNSSAYSHSYSSSSSHGYSHWRTHESAAPVAIHDSTIDPAMIKAGNIAEHRAQPHSTLLCWRYVKEALMAAGGVNSYPQTAYAKDAGRDLVQNHGFVRLSVSSAERAPVGSVLVYGGSVAGHVELRTAHGFVSDYRCSRPSGLPFIGAYARLERHHKDLRTAQIGGTLAAGS